jgi:hypothetical protein
LDSSIIQGPFSVAPCQTLISRFATFSSGQLVGVSQRPVESSSNTLDDGALSSSAVDGEGEQQDAQWPGWVPAGILVPDCVVPQARLSHSATLCGDRVLVVGGWAGGKPGSTYGGVVRDEQAVCVLHLTAQVNLPPPRSSESLKAETKTQRVKTSLLTLQNPHTHTNT